MAEPARPVDSNRGRQGPPSRRCSTCGASYPFDFLVCPKDATSLEVKAEGDDPLIGEVLAGSFCVTGVLGSGGMGRVYEAEHVRLPRRFAVKVMHGELAGNAQAMARFEREAQAVAQVVSEHVLEVVDVVRSRDGRPCIVTELLQGEELGALLDRSGKLPLPTTITICRQVCRGLAAAHAVGIVHRDLKPSNLFLVQRAGGGVHVKILDFGVAKMTDGSNLTRTGMVVGTPAFMAPEQARGSANVDARADVYAIGAVLYRMLTGVAPFPDDEPARTLTRLLTEDPRRPRSIDKTIPEGLEALVQRAMARAPGDRPASVEQLDELLSTFDAARTESVRVITSSTLSKDTAGLGSMDTVALAVESPANNAKDATARARRARPLALALAIVVSLSAGAAVLVTAAILHRVIAGPGALDSTSTAVIAGGAGLVVLLTLFGAMRVLFVRWRSAPAIQRLGEGLRATVLWFFGSLGVLALAWRGYATLGPPPPAAWLEPIELAIVLAPTALALGILLLGFRRAARVT